MKINLPILADALGEKGEFLLLSKNIGMKEEVLFFMLFKQWPSFWYLLGLSLLLTYVDYRNSYVTYQILHFTTYGWIWFEKT